jgi:hypothetical protein
VAEHDGGRRAQPHAVRSLHHLHSRATRESASAWGPCSSGSQPGSGWHEVCDWCSCPMADYECQQ